MGRVDDVFRGGRGLHDQRAGEAGGRPIDPQHHHHKEVVISGGE